MNTEDLSDLSDLPEWQEDQFPIDEDEAENWQTNPTRGACKALYEQWRHVMFLLKGVLQPIMEKDEGDYAEMDTDHAGMLQGDAYIVGVKIRSSEAGGIYTLRMENAAIIRQLAQGIASGILSFAIQQTADADHVNVVRAEIDKFRELFKAWVNTFEKDEFVDEWGLFV